MNRHLHLGVSAAMPTIPESMRVWFLLPCVAGTACGGVQVVPLDRVAQLVEPAAPIDVMVRESGVSEPVMIGRSGFVALQPALRLAIARAVRPWALLHHARRSDGWQLLVELTQADAKRRTKQTALTLAVRATLHARAGNVYLAQTQASCQVVDLVAGKDATPLFERCMDDLGHAVSGWLAGVSP